MKVRGLCYTGGEMRDYPKGVVRVYDAGPDELDRYCVYYTRRAMTANRGYWSYWSAFGHGEGKLGRHNGRLINFADLPDECRRCVMRDLEGP